MSVFEGTAPLVSPTHPRTPCSAPKSARSATIASLCSRPMAAKRSPVPATSLGLSRDKPRNWDAWDVEEDYAERGEQITGVEEIKVVETSPHRVAAGFVRRWRHSHINQTYVVSVERAAPRHRDGARLARPPRLSPHADPSGRARRPRDLRMRQWRAHPADPPEYQLGPGDVRGGGAPCFIDLGEPGFGIACSPRNTGTMRGNVLGMSLVRAPIYPDPLADEGEQRFTYALMPHAGAWHEAGVRQEADDLNQPLLARSVTGLAAGSLAPIARIARRAFRAEARGRRQRPHFADV